MKIIHQQKVNVSVFLSKSLISIITKGINTLSGKIFTCGIQHFLFRIIFQYLITYGLQ